MWEAGRAGERGYFGKLILLDSDRFSEVARFIDVAASCYTDVVCEELDWDGCEDGLGGLVGFWDEDEVVDEVDWEIAVCGSDAYEGAFAGFDFLDVGEGFLEDLALGGEEYTWAFW